MAGQTKLHSLVCSDLMDALPAVIDDNGCARESEMTETDDKLTGEPRGEVSLEKAEDLSEKEPGPAEVPSGRMTENQARGWAILCHIGTLPGLIIPAGNIIAPLVLWMVKKDESDFVDDQDKESLSFQICLRIYFILAALLTIRGMVTISRVLMFLIGAFGIICVITATIKAHRGESYRYPFSMRFVR